MAEAGDDSSRKIHRYIRLTELLPGILVLVDRGRIALTPAVELSYLTRQEQQLLLEAMEQEDCTPSLSQAIQLKKWSQSGKLTREKIFETLREQKPNQRNRISFPAKELRKFFSKATMPPGFRTTSSNCWRRICASAGGPRKDKIPGA